MPRGRFFQSVNDCNVRMIQGSQHAGFALKPRNTFAVAAELFWEEFYCNTSAQLQICGTIYLSHATRSEMFSNVVVRQLFSGHLQRIRQASYLKSSARSGLLGGEDNPCEHPWRATSHRNVSPTRNAIRCERSQTRSRNSKRIPVFGFVQTMTPPPKFAALAVPSRNRSEYPAVTNGTVFRD